MKHKVLRHGDFQPFSPKLSIRGIRTGSKSTTHLVSKKVSNQMKINGSRYDVGRRHERVTPAGFDFKVAASDGSTGSIIFE